MVKVTLVPAALFSLALAKPFKVGDLHLHEKRDGVPSSFVRSGPAPGDMTLPLRIALTSNNEAGLIGILHEVSLPSSPTYGKYLTKEEVEAFVKPTAETTDVVTSWLQQAGLNPETASPSGDWLRVNMTVQQANELMNADFSVFTDQKTGQNAVRTLSYSIPQSLQGHIEVIHPTTSFPDFSRTYGSALSAVLLDDASPLPRPSTCSSAVTPECVLDLYQIPRTPAVNSTNKLALPGYSQQWANEADLKEFLATYRPDIASNTTFSLELIDHGANPQNISGREAALDIQYTIGIASGVPVTFISVGDDWKTGGFGAGDLDVATYLLSQDSPPQVLTTSYGLPEYILSPALMRKICNAFAQLGARGVSVLYASGDNGVGADDGICTAFQPFFPASCPYVTAVGATMLASNGVETVFNVSGGGFSDTFEMPNYQKAAVESYLSWTGYVGEYGSLFNHTGRAIPDVAALGFAIQMVNQGQIVPIYGTSASSPIFASVIALLNDALITAGKSPLGFLNPWLYSLGGSAFTDITSGNNPGCNTAGFNATQGWDPVSGFGTPVFPRLKAALGL